MNSLVKSLRGDNRIPVVDMESLKEMLLSTDPTKCYYELAIHGSTSYCIWFEGNWYCFTSNGAVISADNCPRNGYNSSAYAEIAYRFVSRILLSARQTYLLKVHVTSSLFSANPVKPDIRFTSFETIDGDARSPADPTVLMASLPFVTRDILPIGTESIDSMVSKITSSTPGLIFNLPGGKMVFLPNPAFEQMQVYLDRNDLLRVTALLLRYPDATGIAPYPELIRLYKYGMELLDAIVKIMIELYNVTKGRSNMCPTSVMFKGKVNWNCQATSRKGERSYPIPLIVTPSIKTLFSHADRGAIDIKKHILELSVEAICSLLLEFWYSDEMIRILPYNKENFESSVRSRPGYDGRAIKWTPILSKVPDKILSKSFADLQESCLAIRTGAIKTTAEIGWIFNHILSNPSAKSKINFERILATRAEALHVATLQNEAIGMQASFADCVNEANPVLSDTIMQMPTDYFLTILRNFRERVGRNLLTAEEYAMIYAEFMVPYTTHG